MKNLDPSNICYIHGKVRESLTDIESPLVMGIDEYLDKDCQNKDVDWVIFKKFFQRIYRHSDYKYKGWEIYSNDLNVDTELYIYGHSLVMTDRDVLYDLIINGNQATTNIFYRNSSQLANELKNLIKLIGSDELNERTRSVPPSIVFLKQE